ncbi:MAG: translation initiation factor 1 [Chthoniobacter sp.]|jgi:translation initiation factor 1|nr:translation initiation factor 1 [Chthoniobacter sp.]
MRPGPKKRIDTNPAQPGLNPAFAQLPLDPTALPAGPEPPPPAPADPLRVWKMGRVILRRETAHRGGKTVVVVHDFATHLPPSVIETIAKKLRQSCGCGGTVRERTIEIQGDQVPRIRALLEAEGFQVAGVR